MDKSHVMHLLHCAVPGSLLDFVLFAPLLRFFRWRCRGSSDLNLGMDVSNGDAHFKQVFAAARYKFVRSAKIKIVAPIKAKSAERQHHAKQFHVYLAG